MWLTGYPATGKTTIGNYICDTHKWYMCDGDEFVGNDSELEELIRGTMATGFNLMRGTEEEAKEHDAEVRTMMEPFWRAFFEKMTQIKESKILFVYVCWR